MLHIVFFDNDIAVCLKPRGVLSEGADMGAMPELLARTLAEEGRSVTVYPVHRLDRDTEGLMVYAFQERLRKDEWKRSILPSSAERRAENRIR